MALINPGIQFAQAIKQLVTSGAVDQLSPEARQSFLQAMQHGGGMSQDPAFRAAVQEASSKGLMPHMTAKDWIMFAAVPLAAFGGAALMGAGAATSAATLPIAAEATGTTLPATVLGSGLGPTMAATSSLGTSATTAGGILSTIGSVYNRVQPFLDAAGHAVGDATQAAGENRINADEVARRAAADFENQQQQRARLEAEQRDSAEKDVYRAGWYANHQPGPYDTQGATPISPAYQQTLSELEQQAMAKLAKGPQYSTDAMKAIRPFTPTPPSTPERIGTWASPILTALGRGTRARA